MKHIAVWPLLKQTVSEWSEDKAPKMAASLAYYTATCVAPLLVAALGIFTLVVHKHVDPVQLHKQLASLTDPSVADSLQTTIDKAATGHSGVIASVVGIVLAVVSASAVFAELQDSLNTIWEVRPKPNRGIWGVIQDRFMSMSMVLGIAFLLLISTVVTSVLTGVSSSVFGDFLGGGAKVTATIVLEVTFVVSTGVVTILFAAMFKVLPDVRIAWRDVWLGAFLTALLFQVGKELLGIYIGKAAPGSAFGALGSIVVMLVWVYYSAYILFFGAEFTQVYANQYGSHIVPAKNAEPLTEDMRKQAGIPHAEDSASHPDQAKPKKGKPARPARSTAAAASAGGSDFTSSTPALAQLAARPSPRRRSQTASALRYSFAARYVPIVASIVLTRFIWKRVHAVHHRTATVTDRWQVAGEKWKRLGKLFVSNKRDRHVMTHGPDGAKGPTWEELSKPRQV